MLSQAECGKMFKACQRKNSKTLHTPYLVFSEFVECLAFLTFLHFSKEEYENEKIKDYITQLQIFVKWLSKKDF